MSDPLSSGTSERPPVVGLGVLVVGAVVALVLLFAVVLPALAWLLSLLLPVGLIAAGALLVSRGERTGRRSTGRWGWVLAALGAVWLLGRLDFFDYVPFF